MLVEGPIVTAASAFAVGLGYFNPFIIYALSVLGDIIPDLAFYAIGYWGRTAAVDRFGKYFGLTPAIVSRTERILKRHAAKAIIIFKLAPIISLPGIIVAGATRIPAKKFLAIDILFTFPNSLLFMALGFYFGRTFSVVMGYVQNVQYAILAIILLTLGTYFIYKKISARIAQKLEDRG